LTHIWNIVLLTFRERDRHSSLNKYIPGGSDDKRICLQCKRLGFKPWVGKIPWRREWQPTPVFLLGEFRGQRSLAG